MTALPNPDAVTSATPTIGKIGTLKDRRPDQENPFVVGEDAVDRFLTVLGECALATKAYVEANPPKDTAEKK